MTDYAIESPVKRQLEAYNARDIDAFMEPWAPDARYYAFPDTLLAQGTAEIRARHALRFQETNLHGRLRHRISVGNLVIDHETVTRSFPEGPGHIDVIAIYEVQDNKITAAWFRMGTPVLDATP